MKQKENVIKCLKMDFYCVASSCPFALPAEQIACFYVHTHRRISHDVSIEKQYSRGKRLARILTNLIFVLR